MAILMMPYYLFNYAFNDYAYPAVSRSGAYVFCYFTGNEVDEQKIHLAVSTDGYNFEALNDNKAIIEQTKGTGCVRDPYIFKAVDENGKRITPDGEMKLYIGGHQPDAVSTKLLGTECLEINLK
jgi:hypothetical protein